MLKLNIFLSAFLYFVAGFLFAADEATIAPTHPALTGSFPRLEFRESFHEKTIERLRAKGTFLLRKNTNNEAAILVFEYRFDPLLVTGGSRRSANYVASDVPFDKVLRDVLAQFDLDFEIISPDRIAIVARKKNEPE